MSAQSNQLYVAAMQSVITNRELTDVSVLMAISFQLMGGVVWVSWIIASLNSYTAIFAWYGPLYRI